jgi:hypothetical protein
MARPFDQTGGLSECFCQNQFALEVGLDSLIESQTKKQTNEE